MINATELRIGNLVRLKEHDAQVKVEQYQLCESDLIDVQPIPITRDWLLKNGFKEYIDFGLRTGTYDKMPLCGFAYSMNTKKVMILHDGNHLCHWIDIKIEYVHQLQNIYFALRGEELITKI